jgi:hypothetical protein
MVCQEDLDSTNVARQHAVDLGIADGEVAGSNSRVVDVRLCVGRDARLGGGEEGRGGVAQLISSVSTCASAAKRWSPPAWSG